MDFVVVMVFTKQVFYLSCSLLFQIKSQFGVAYKSVVYKRTFNILLKSSKKEKITLLCYMSLFLCLFRISLGQCFAKNERFAKNIKKEWLLKWVICRRRVQNFCTL